MKVLTVHSGYIVETRFISDNAIADAAYATLKEAMSSYEKYRTNDKGKTVSVDLGGAETIFVLDSLSNVSIEDCAKSDDEIVEREIYKERLKARITAALAPATNT